MLVAGLMKMSVETVRADASVVEVMDIDEDALSDGTGSSVVTFTFSEAVDPASVVTNVAGGTLSTLVWNATNTAATATFTAAQDSDVAGSVAVVSYTDVAGNAGAGGSDTVTIGNGTSFVLGGHGPPGVAGGCSSP